MSETAAPRLPARRAAPLLALGAVAAVTMGGAYLLGESARASADAAALLARVRTEAPRLLTAILPPAPPLRASLSDARDLECLTQAVYYESRGEPEGGQAGVAQVVLNRVGRRGYPRSVCGVVFEHVRRGCQFSFACDRQTRRPREFAAWVRAERVARRALAGARSAQVGSATQFRVAGLSSEGLVRVAQIGAHVFYRLGHAPPRPRTPSPELAGEGAPPQPPAVAAPPVAATPVQVAAAS